MRDKTRTEGSNPSPSAILLILIIPLILQAADLEVRTCISLNKPFKSSIETCFNFKDLVRSSGEKVWGREIVIERGEGVRFLWSSFDPKKVFLVPAYMLVASSRGEELVSGKGENSGFRGMFRMENGSLSFSGTVKGDFGKAKSEGSFSFGGRVSKGEDETLFSYNGTLHLKVGIECFSKEVSISYKSLGVLRW